MKCLDAMYICTTPLQVMSAVSLAMTRKERADLYIDPQFEDAISLAQRIREERIFENVVTLEDLESIRRVRYAKGKKERYLAILSLYRNIRKAAEEILLPDTSYRRMYATHNVFVANILMLYISRYRIRTKICYYDDGEGSYDNRDIFRISAADRVGRRIALGSRKLRSCSLYYMYSPELFRAMHPENTIPVHALPNFSKSPEVRAKIEKIFAITEDKGIEEPVIILDALKELVLSPEDDARIVRLYDRLKEEFGEDKVIVKRHPRDSRIYENPIRTYPFPTLPFEVTCLASDTSQMSLITLLSTATIMPKLLLDEEPQVILLYHLFKRLEGNDEDRDRFFELTRETWRDPDKIRIPDSEEELDEIIREIKERIR
ncbi:MAG: hypothetical protein IKQ49_11600 [Eubacterium sp.]|nr:hypothetical protein [Eubacterium sp.]